MKIIMAIFLGGGIGSVLRYLIVECFPARLINAFPYRILVVNILGSLLIGFLATLFVHKFPVSPVWRAAILIGVLGGLTTFSSFSAGTFDLLREGALWLAGMNILANVVLCLLATFLGYFLALNVG